MTGHIKGQGRHQATLLPEVLDDFIDENNPVRAIDAFVEGLQFKTLGFESAEAKLTRRPGYHPATLLKLYLYGYLNRVQSSRRLERGSHRNVELILSHILISDSLILLTPQVSFAIFSSFPTSPELISSMVTSANEASDLSASSVLDISSENIMHDLPYV